MITARQRLLLKAIIEEFINSAEEVGSVALREKYSLNFSPATIRNEMARLAELGLLEKSHVSSGRRPTAVGMRYFLNDLLEEFAYEDLDMLVTATIHESLFQKRFNVDKLLTEAVIALYQLTDNTVIALINGRRYLAGVSQIVDQPEYRDLERLKKILSIMEDYNILSELFLRYTRNEEIVVLIGEETGIDQLNNSAIVFAPIKLYNLDNSYIGVIGPNRMNYAKVIPALKYIAESIKEVAEGW